MRRRTTTDGSKNVNSMLYGAAWRAAANAPRRPDAVQERLANARHVSDWLRERADREEATHG